MKDKILMVVVMLTMVVSGVACFGNMAKADVQDKPYNFNSYNSSGNTEWRIKENTTKVYVHPLTGPSIYYVVRGWLPDPGEGEVHNNKCSKKFEIFRGTQASITNTVVESGCTKARLKFLPVTQVNLDTTGEWSPDSTRNYQIFK